MTRIAILGGGVGALSAAFELTELDRGGDYEITVYQMGWRLGGKGAVGRNVDIRHRVEEHGLHVWAGFYDNAFGLVDKCYGALREAGRPVPFGSRLDAFTGLDRVTLMQQEAGGWSPWSFELPRRPGTPGDPQPPAYATLVDHVLGLLELASDRAQAMSSRDGDAPQRRALRDVVDSARSLPDSARNVRPQHRKRLQQGIREARKGGWPARGTQTQATLDASAGVAPSCSAVLVDLALAMAHGILEDEAFEGGLDALDKQEWTAWMRSHGCSEASLGSAVARACYDYVFGFVHGETRDFGAGTGTRLLLKLLFGYKGSFFYIMRATMGELLFAPLYHVLRERGVRFEFFHRVDKLAYSADENAIDRIDMTVQATTRDGRDYDPLIRIPDGAGSGGTLDSWPAHPKFDLLNEGRQFLPGQVDLESAWAAWPTDKASAKSLVRGRDFDEVVLGISIGAFPSICSELIARKPAWEAMVRDVRTVPTMALQLWTTCPTGDLVRRPSGQPQVAWNEADPATLVSSFAKPLDTWGDMSLLLGQETESPTRPEGLHYFVSSFVPKGEVPSPGPGAPDFPATQLKIAKERQLDWIESSLGALWPGLFDERGGVRWNLLFDPSGASGQNRFDAQYSRVNINPSDQYVQSVTGSLYSRMRANGSGIDNLSLAGDWVRTGINAGCVESAVMAGRAAAGAIAGVEIDMPNSDYPSGIGAGMINAALPALAALHKVERAAAGGSGTIDAYCVICRRPDSEIQEMLPPGMILADDRKRTQTIVYVFARQRDVRPGLVPFGGLRYAEVFTIIPGVVLEDSAFSNEVLFGFMPALLLDHPVPVFLGRTLYGFNKDLARIDCGEGTFDVRCRLGGVSAHFLPDGPPGPISRFDEIDKLRGGLQLPLVGQAKDGSFVVSSVHWDFDKGSFQRISGTVDTGSPFMSKPDRFDLGMSTNDGKPWGFRMNCRWRLSLPIGDLGVPRAGDSNRLKLKVMASQAVVGNRTMR